MALLEQGLWNCNSLVIHRAASRKGLRVRPEDALLVRKLWDGRLANNPKAFAGPTLRLVGHHEEKKKLVLEVVPSDYREAQLFGWLGCAMAPITIDDHMVLQKPVSSIAGAIGGGVRVPGCTLVPGKDVCAQIVEEMNDEFGVKVAKEQVLFHGLLEVFRQEKVLHHFGLVASVLLPYNCDSLRGLWLKAKDRAEGEITFRRIARTRRYSADLLLEMQMQSRLVLAMLLDWQDGSDRVTQWGDHCHLW